MRGSTLPSLSKALEWGSEGGDPVTARLMPLDCKPGRAACEAVLPEEQKAEKQVRDCQLFFQEQKAEKQVRLRAARPLEIKSAEVSHSPSCR